MLYCIFNTVLGDIVLGSLGIRSVLKLLFSFNERNCVTESIHKILNNNEEKEWKDISKILLSEDLVRKFRNRVNWGYISYFQKLSEEFIREFRNRVVWKCISSYQKLSEEFVREFRDSVDWKHIFYYQELSEDFVHEFRNRVDWYQISITQHLSEDFFHGYR